MFDYELMTETALEIEIMEASADFDYTMSVLEISFMESANGEVFTEGVLETAKDYIMKIYEKIRKAVMEAKAKVSAKVADIKLKAAIKKYQALGLANLRTNDGKKVKLLDIPKVMKALNEHTKIQLDYYKWIANYDVTDENAADFVEEVRRRRTAIEDRMNRINLADEYFIMSDINDCIRNSHFGTDGNIKFYDAIIKVAEQEEKAAKEVVDKITKQSKLYEGAKSVKEKVTAITKQAAKNAPYYIKIAGLQTVAAFSFMNVLNYFVDNHGKSVSSADASLAAINLGIGVGTANAAYQVKEELKSKKAAQKQ